MAGVAPRFPRPDRPERIPGPAPAAARLNAGKRGSCGDDGEEAEDDGEDAHAASVEVPCEGLLSVVLAVR
jgi:hypothetical protein